MVSFSETRSEHAAQPWLGGGMVGVQSSGPQSYIPMVRKAHMQPLPRLLPSPEDGERYGERRPRTTGKQPLLRTRFDPAKTTAKGLRCGSLRNV